MSITAMAFKGWTLYGSGDDGKVYKRVQLYGGESGYKYDDFHYEWVEAKL